jgi:hypothetical protein
MTDECISPLRRRMIEDMTVRNFVVKTQTDYIRRVKSFAVFLRRSPDTATRKMSDATCCIWHRAEWARQRSTALARRCGFCST